MQDSLLISPDLQYLNPPVLPQLVRSTKFHQNKSNKQTKTSHQLYLNPSPFFSDILFLRGKRFRLRLRSSSLYYITPPRTFYTDVFLLFKLTKLFIWSYLFLLLQKIFFVNKKLSAALKEVCTPFRAVPKDQTHDRFKLIEVFYSPKGMWLFL